MDFRLTFYLIWSIVKVKVIKIKKIKIKIGNVEKLISNLNNKTNYVVHYENLKLYESLGLKITKIHRGITFEESAWLEEYINLNTQLRIEAKISGNYFEVDFFKANEQFCLR